MAKSSKKRSSKSSEMVHVSIPLSTLMAHLSKATGIKAPKRKKAAKKAVKRAKGKASPAQLRARRKFALNAKKRARAARRARR